MPAGRRVGHLHAGSPAGPPQSRRVAAGLAALLVALPFAVVLSAGSAGATAATGATASATPTAAPTAPRANAMIRIAAAPRIPVGDVALGPVPSSTVEHAEIALKPRDEARLKSFVAAVADRRSPQYHHYLARGAYRAAFGPTEATIAAVEAQLRADGLHVSGVSSDGLLVRFDGTAATVERAFRTGLERYRLGDGEAGLATTGAVEVPATIAPEVAGVLGLDDLVREQPSYFRPGVPPAGTPKAVSPKFPHPPGSPTPCADAQADAATAGGLTDDAIAHSYGAFGLYGAGDLGQGQHIAIFELQPFLRSDIQTFDTCYFGAAAAAQMQARLSVLPVDGGELQPGQFSQDDEATLDVEDVSAIAPGASIDVYEAPNTTFGSIDEYAQIVEQDTDQVVTTSWLIGCEQTAQLAAPGIPYEENVLFEEAAAQGQTVFVAAGDTGADECNLFRFTPEPPGQNVLSVLDPGAQPYVVSAGGTSIDNASQPPTEHVWNDGANWGGGGGGISEAWTMPSWQRPLALTTANATDVNNAENLENATAAAAGGTATPTFCAGTLGIAGASCREVPDVSAEADEFTGSITIYGVNLGYGPPNGWATIGGTSSSAPIWAALLALVNASAPCDGDLVGGVPDAGFAAPLLYGVAANPAAAAASFSDVTVGDNDVYGLDNGLSFPARTGFDMASGLGTPQLTTPGGGNGLAYYLCQYGPTQAPPTVTNLSPTSGTTAGGETVVVTGSGFGAPGSPLVRSVQVGAGQAASFSVVDGTTLDVVMPDAVETVPAGSPDPTQDGAGPAEITVTATDGESSVVGSGSLFEYVDESSGSGVPSVTGVSPYGGLDTAPAGAAGVVTVFGSGFVAGSTSVEFGGVEGTDVTVVQPYELTVVPPDLAALAPATACPTDTAAQAADDVCQVNVTVTVSGQTSRTADILPPYTGVLAANTFGAVVLPAGCGCEDEPQPTEFDYVPAPTITSVSTTSPATYASEFGGSTTNTVTLTGTGMDLLTFGFLTLGGDGTSDSIFFPIAASGTSVTLEAPAILGPFGQPTIDPLAVPVAVSTLAGTSSSEALTYAGVPFVTSVVDSATGKSFVPAVSSCGGSGCGVPISIAGEGLAQATGPIYFDDVVSGTDLSTQSTYTVGSDTSISTTSVQQNPDLVSVVVCSNTACGLDLPFSELIVYPPGDPVISGITPASGPAHGGNEVAITGSNLGCAEAVFFGSKPAFELSNAQALLDCGQTGEVDAVVPPGVAGRTVQVRVVTVESDATGSRSDTVGYTYRTSAPSVPQHVEVTTGGGSATLRWSAPATGGGTQLLQYFVAAVSPGRAPVSASLAATTTSYFFRYLQPGVPWTFTVQAYAEFGPSVKARVGPVAPPLGDNGYLVATTDGAVFGFGSLASAGGAGGGRIGGKVAGIAATPFGLGYWLATTTGNVYAFGDAGFYGRAPSLAGSHIAVVGIASTGTGHGYWLLDSHGTVYSFGDARFDGASSGTDFVGIAATPDGHGYYLAEADGAVKAFGDAVRRGDMKGKPLHAPIVGIAVNPQTGGYWELGGDGGVFAFGGAGYFGSMIGRHLNGAAVGMTGTPDGKGYWVEAADNGLFTFGSARYAGNAAREALSAGASVAS